MIKLSYRLSVTAESLILFRAVSYALKNHGKFNENDRILLLAFNVQYLS